MEDLKKAPTWLDLKDFAATLNEEQLSQPIRWWGDDRGGTVSSVSLLGEDYISDGEGYSPESSFDSETLEELKEDNDGTLSKDTPIIFVD